MLRRRRRFCCRLSLSSNGARQCATRFSSSLQSSHTYAQHTHTHTEMIAVWLRVAHYVLDDELNILRMCVYNIRVR